MNTNKEKIKHKDLSYKITDLAMQAPISVYFEGEVVGNYCADILVEDKIILELKASEKIVNIHRAQTLNYLKATGLKLTPAS